jgi:hypothetical protein
MPSSNRQPKSQPLDQKEAHATNDEALKDLLLANAIKLPKQETHDGHHLPTKERSWVPAWLSTVLLLCAVPLALLTYGSSADEEDFYL